MGKSKLPETPNSYGMPLYGAAWAPLEHVQSRFRSHQPRAEGEGNDGERPHDAVAANCSYLVLTGSGGEGRSGIPNAVLLAEFDFASGSLSQQPVAKLGTGSDFPYRMAVHPQGELFEWEGPDNAEDKKLGLKVSEKVVGQLEDAGLQLALVFSHDGSLLAAGGEDETFGFCRFSQSSDGTQVLYVTAFTGRWASILTWNTSSWKRIGSKHVGCDSVNAFNVSADGKLLAVGMGGDIVILNSTSMRTQTVMKKAHLGFVTALVFSHDSRAIISVSTDSSATVQDTNTGGGSRLWLIISISTCNSCGIHEEMGPFPLAQSLFLTKAIVDA